MEFDTEDQVLFNVLFTVLENAAFARLFALHESFAACLALAKALFFLYINLVTISGFIFGAFDTKEILLAKINATNPYLALGTIYQSPNCHHRPG